MASRRLRRRFVSGWSRVGRAASVAVIAWAGTAGLVGCKSGSWSGKSAWPFSGSSADNGKLAAAPAFEGAPTKPSATAKPYPTTTTPQGYVITDKNAAAPALPAAEPSAVTYGTTPPPAAAPAAATVASAATTPEAPRSSGGSLSGIVPQVGPYQSSPVQASPVAGPDPAAFAAMPPAAPTSPPAAGLPSGPGLSPAPAARVADARSDASWGGSMASAPGSESRYGGVTGSRFSSSGAPPTAAFDPGAAPPAAPPLAAPVTQAVSTGLSAAPPTPAPAQAVQPASSTAWPGVGPATMPTESPLPAAAPAAPATPTRRPDPGYRPGGTSSYQPNRALIAAGGPLNARGIAGTMKDEAVRPASFEADAAPAE